MKCNHYPNTVNKDKSSPQFIYQMCVCLMQSDSTTTVVILILPTYFVQNLCGEAFIALKS